MEISYRLATLARQRSHCARSIQFRNRVCGNRRRKNFAIDSYYGAGILKSTNAGATWKNIVGPFLHAYIGGIAVSPSNNQVLLCASNIGIFRSTDGAETWTSVLDGSGTAVLFDPTNGNIAYAALGSPLGAFNNGIYRSTDGGQTFESIRGTGSSVFFSV